MDFTSTVNLFRPSSSSLWMGRGRGSGTGSGGSSSSLIDGGARGTLTVKSLACGALTRPQSPPNEGRDPSLQEDDDDNRENDNDDHHADYADNHVDKNSNNQRKNSSTTRRGKMRQMISNKSAFRTSARSLASGFLEVDNPVVEIVHLSNNDHTTAPSSSLEEDDDEEQRVTPQLSINLSKSLTLSESPTKGEGRESLSVGSTASADSFVLLHGLGGEGGSEGHHDVFYDPYLDGGDHWEFRSVKKDPYIPPFDDPAKATTTTTRKVTPSSAYPLSMMGGGRPIAYGAFPGDSVDDFLTACSSMGQTQQQQQQQQGIYNNMKSLLDNTPMASSAAESSVIPRTLQVPSKPAFSRHDSASMDGSKSSTSTSSSRKERRARRAQKELEYWQTIVSARSATYGTIHRQTAEGHYSLGHAYMRKGDCDLAMASFKSASRIWRLLEGPTHLSVARALDAYGLAALRSTKAGDTLVDAKEMLEEAFTIRFHLLGIWHVDTVETFNKIGSVHLYMGNLEDACRSYEEVYFVRKAIFGLHHPSVAISAHSLANVHMKLSNVDHSNYFFHIALHIYTEMHLSLEHPTVAQLLRDQKRLERLASTVFQS